MTKFRNIRRATAVKRFDRLSKAVFYANECMQAMMGQLGAKRMYIKMNNIITKDVTVYFTYVYKGSTITMQSTTNTSSPAFTYEISVTGNKMRVGNQENGYFDLTKKK